MHDEVHFIVNLLYQNLIKKYEDDLATEFKTYRN